MNGDLPLLITVAPNGAYLTKADHPAVPTSIPEIARTAAACADEGAAMIHLHVRDRDGGHLLDAATYREATAAIRREAGDGLIVQITTEAAGRYGPDEQMAVVRDARPEAASLGLRELVADDAREKPFAHFLRWMMQERIWPQFILYDLDDLARFAELRGRGVIPGPAPFLLLVLGRRHSPAHPADLVTLLPRVPGEAHWAVCAFGPREGACTLTAAALGGHSRIGFENNTLLAEGRPASDNAALVGRMRTGAGLIGRNVATGDEARARLAASAFE